MTSTWWKFRGGSKSVVAPELGDKRFASVRRRKECRGNYRSFVNVYVNYLVSLKCSCANYELAIALQQRGKKED